MKKAEREVYRESYKKGSAKISADRLPEVKHSNGFQPIEAYLLAAGIVERDGQRLEFQEIRLYFAKDSS